MFQNLGIYPYDRLSDMERVIVLSRIAESLSGFNDNLETNILYESALEAVFTMLRMRVRDEILLGEKIQSHDVTYVIRFFVATAYEQAYNTSASIIGLHPSSPRICVWNTVVDLLAKSLFGYDYAEKKRMFREPIPARRKEYLNGYKQSYFDYTLPKMSVADVQLTFKKLMTMSRSALEHEPNRHTNCFCQDCITDLDVPLRFKLQVLEEDAQGKRKGKKGKKKAGAAAALEDVDASSPSLEWYKENAEKYRELDTLILSHREELEAFWLSLEPDTQVSLTELSAAQLGEAMQQSEHWEVLRAACESYVKFAWMSDTLTVSEDRISISNANNPFENETNKKELLSLLISSLERMDEGRLFEEELVLHQFERQSRVAFEHVIHAEFARKIGAHFVLRKEESRAHQNALDLEMELMREEEDQVRAAEKKAKKKKKKKKGKGGDNKDDSSEDTELESPVVAMNGNSKAPEKVPAAGEKLVPSNTSQSSKTVEKPTTATANSKASSGGALAGETKKGAAAEVVTTAATVVTAAGSAKNDNSKPAEGAASKKSAGKGKGTAATSNGKVAKSRAVASESESSEESSDSDSDSYGADGAIILKEEIPTAVDNIFAMLDEDAEPAPLVQEKKKTAKQLRKEKALEAKKKKQQQKQQEQQHQQQQQQQASPKKNKPRGLPPVDVNERNWWRRYDEGMMFICTKDTYNQCMDMGLMGLPRIHVSLVETLRAHTTILFLFDVSDRVLHGIFEATSDGGDLIEPTAWVRNRYKPCPFPAQIRFRPVARFTSLPEHAIRHIFHDGNRVRKLDRDQIHELVHLFIEWNEESPTSVEPTNKKGAQTTPTAGSTSRKSSAKASEPAATTKPSSASVSSSSNVNSASASASQTVLKPAPSPVQNVWKKPNKPLVAGEQQKTRRTVSDVPPPSSAHTASSSRPQEHQRRGQDWETGFNTFEHGAPSRTAVAEAGNNFGSFDSREGNRMGPTSSYQRSTPPPGLGTSYADVNDGVPTASDLNDMWSRHHPDRVVDHQQPDPSVHNRPQSYRDPSHGPPGQHHENQHQHPQHQHQQHDRSLSGVGFGRGHGHGHGEVVHDRSSWEKRHSGPNSTTTPPPAEWGGFSQQDQWSSTPSSSMGTSSGNANTGNSSSWGPPLPSQQPPSQQQPHPRREEDSFFSMSSFSGPTGHDLRHAPGHESSSHQYQSQPPPQQQHQQHQQQFGGGPQGHPPGEQPSRYESGPPSYPPHQRSTSLGHSLHQGYDSQPPSHSHPSLSGWSHERSSSVSQHQSASSYGGGGFHGGFGANEDDSSTRNAPPPGMDMFLPSSSSGSVWGDELSPASASLGPSGLAGEPHFSGSDSWSAGPPLMSPSFRNVPPPSFDEPSFSNSHSSYGGNNAHSSSSFGMKDSVVGVSGLNETSWSSAVGPSHHSWDKPVSGPPSSVTPSGSIGTGNNQYSFDAPPPDTSSSLGFMGDIGGRYDGSSMHSSHSPSLQQSHGQPQMPPQAHHHQHPQHSQHHSLSDQQSLHNRSNSEASSYHGFPASNYAGPLPPLPSSQPQPHVGDDALSLLGNLFDDPVDVAPPGGFYGSSQQPPRPEHDMWGSYPPQGQGQQQHYHGAQHHGDGSQPPNNNGSNRSLW